MIYKVTGLLYTVMILPLLWNNIFPQEVQRFGLEGMNVNDIKFYNGYLFAATDSGVYRREIWESGTDWIHIGLENKKVNVIYPHDVGPISWTVTAGVSPAFIPGDSALIYCYCDSAWTIADTGIDRKEVASVVSMDGFPSPVICGETYAAGNGKLFRRKVFSWYEEVFDIGIGPVNVVKTSFLTGDVWNGGETGIFAPFISRSTDLGDTWETSFPDLGGDNACNSIEFHPTDTNVVFAGMEGLVIKSTDGGITWDSTGLTNTPFYFYGLAYDYNLNILYAAGSTNTNEFGLYYSEDQGKTWMQIKSNESFKGVSSIVLAPTFLPEVSTLYLATFGDGILWLQPLLPGVEDEDSFIEDYKLYQNYPNPFNPITKIGFRIADFGFVSLKVYDILGKQVKTLVNEEKSPGEYEIEFNALNLSSGLYFYTLDAGGKRLNKKMCLIK